MELSEHLLSLYTSGIYFVHVLSFCLSIYIICFFITELIYLFWMTGAEAKRVFDDAQKLLSRIISQGSLQAQGVVAFFPANSTGDDIELYEDDSRSKVMTRLFGLRQQVMFSRLRQ